MQQTTDDDDDDDDDDDEDGDDEDDDEEEDEEGFARVGEEVEERRTWHERKAKPTHLRHVRRRRRRTWRRSETMGPGRLACMVRRDTKENETKRKVWNEGRI